MLPGIGLEPSIPHYYGDYVRQIFMLAGAAMLILAPFLINRSPELIPFEIAGAIILVCLAALTNPHKQLVMTANVIAAGAVVLMYEILALSAYAAGDTLIFIEREALAVLLLFALYFSVKTLRNMILGQTGKRDRVGDFIDSD